MCFFLSAPLRKFYLEGRGREGKEVLVRLILTCKYMLLTVLVYGLSIKVHKYPQFMIVYVTREGLPSIQRKRFWDLKVHSQTTRALQRKLNKSLLDTISQSISCRLKAERLEAVHYESFISVLQCRWTCFIQQRLSFSEALKLTMHRFEEHTAESLIGEAFSLNLNFINLSR